jgi:chorismate synthase
VYPIQIGKIKANTIDTDYMLQNELYWPDEQNYTQVINYLRGVKGEKDSIGGVVEVRISSVSAGLGEPVFERLDACIAKAIIGIPGIRGIEFGDGFLLSEMSGSMANDVLSVNGFCSNHQGGIVGGVSNGNDIILRIAVRAPSSIGKTQKAISHDMEETELTIKGRHDVCLIPRILSVIESMIQLTLADAIAHQDLISQNDKDLNAYREAIDKIDEDILIALYRRFEIVRSIQQYKEKHNLSVYDSQREQDILTCIADFAGELGLSEGFVQRLWMEILTESKHIQVDPDADI